jgi:hypothetical protein
MLKRLEQPQFQLLLVPAIDKVTPLNGYIWQAANFFNMKLQMETAAANPASQKLQ